jgi:hypothetical protein
MVGKSNLENNVCTQFSCTSSGMTWSFFERMFEKERSKKETVEEMAD